MEVAAAPDASRIAVMWFGFHPRETIRDAWRNRRWTIFGHVECWGINEAGVCFIFDPRAKGTHLWLSADVNAFDVAVAARILVCASILRYFPGSDAIGLPFHPMMNCASQCAHIVGLRAYSPWTLRRILLGKGAVETVNDPERRP